MKPILSLEIQAEGQAPERYLLDLNIIYVGRFSENHIVLEDTEVSRSHFRIVKDKDNSYRVEDQASENGIYLNGQKVEKAPVSIGDKINIGNLILCFVDDENAQKIAAKPLQDHAHSLDATMNINESDLAELNSQTQSGKQIRSDLSVQLLFKINGKIIEKNLTFHSIDSKECSLRIGNDSKHFKIEE